MGRRSTRWSDTNVKSGCRLVPPTRTASTESVSAHLEVLEATRQAFAQRQIEFFGDTQRRRRRTNVDERQLELFGEPLRHLPDEALVRGVDDLEGLRVH